MRTDQELRAELARLEADNERMHKTQLEEDVAKCRSNNAQIAALNWVLQKSDDPAAAGLAEGMKRVINRKFSESAFYKNQYELRQLLNQLPGVL